MQSQQIWVQSQQICVFSMVVTSSEHAWHLMCDAQLFFSFSREWAYYFTIVISHTMTLQSLLSIKLIVLNWRHMLSDIQTLLSIPEVNRDTISEKIMGISLSLASFWVPTPATSICLGETRLVHGQGRCNVSSTYCQIHTAQWLRECLLSTSDRKLVEHSQFQWQ